MSAGLNIVVCIKQVPETTEVNFDEETGRLIREGVAAVINPFDEYAIEEGLRIKEKHGGSVKVLTMGPPWAADALRDAIAMGADEGYLATDRVFAGADTWATSLTLAKTIEHMGGYDIIICGLKTTNGDLKLPVEEIGLDGSYTRVVKIFEPEVHHAGEVVEGTTEELVEAIFAKLQECKVI